jgi:prepilin peptidase CpaA
MGKSRVSDLPRQITGAGAVILSGWFLIRTGTNAAVAVASIYFILACTVDALHSRIPNLLNAGLCLAGLVLNIHQTGWSGLLTSVSGLALGIGLLLLPWLMGGFGAGDVKALGALGALIGPKPLLHVFVYMALFGGAMAVLHYLCNRNLKQKAAEWWTCAKACALTGDPRQLPPGHREPLRFPYAAAIAFGYFTWLIRGPVL